MTENAPAAATIDLTRHDALGVEQIGADPLALPRIYALPEGAP